MSEARAPVNATAASLVGSLAAFPLLDVLELLNRTGRTGELQVVSPEADHRLFVDQGELVAEVERDHDRSGSRQDGALDTGTVTGNDGDGGGGGAPGGALGDRPLFRSACAEDGWFYFSDGVPVPEEGQRHSLDEVLSELGPAVTEWRELVADLPFHAVLRLADATPAAEVQIQAGEWQLLSKLGNQPRGSVEHLLDAAEGEPLALLRILRGLLRAGLVEVDIAAEPPPAAAGLPGAPQVGGPGAALAGSPGGPDGVGNRSEAAGTTGVGRTPDGGAASRDTAGSPAPPPTGPPDASTIEWAASSVVPDTHAATTETDPPTDAAPPSAPGAPGAPGVPGPGATPVEPVRSGEQLPPFFPVGGPPATAGVGADTGVPVSGPGGGASTPPDAPATPPPPPSSVMPPPITGDPWSSSLVDH